jgi:hypothetical protein
MTAYRVVVAERKDFSIVGVACDECGTTVTLAIESAKIPESCSSCGKQLSDNIKNALAGLARFQRMGRVAEENAGKPIFRFDIKQND